MTIQPLILVCSGCPRRIEMECHADTAAPVSIIERAKAMFCPTGRFANQIALAEMEAAGMTVEIATQDAKRRSCCDPPPP